MPSDPTPVAEVDLHDPTLEYLPVTHQGRLVVVLLNTGYVAQAHHGEPTKAG